MLQAGCEVQPVFYEAVNWKSRLVLFSQVTRHRDIWDLTLQTHIRVRLLSSLRLSFPVLAASTVQLWQVQHCLWSFHMLPAAPLKGSWRIYLLLGTPEVEASEAGRLVWADWLTATLSLTPYLQLTKTSVAKWVCCNHWSGAGVLHWLAMF